MIKSLALSLGLLSLVSNLSAQKFGNFTPDEQITYKTIGDTELKLHVFNPEGHSKDQSRPAIVFFFGGGWVSGSPGQFYSHCEYLSARGIVAISAEYRVKSRHQTTPIECVKDGKSAIRWVKKNAAQLGVDPTKVLAGGGSAGGHVAAATATLSKFDEDTDDLSISPVPAALVLFNPVYDNSPKGWNNRTVAAYWQDISPAHNLSKDTPPVITFFGTNDSCLSVPQIKAFDEKAKALGVNSQLHLYEGQKHGFFNYGRNEHFEITLLEADKFLSSLGYLEGAPNKNLLPKPPVKKAKKQ